jgi:hypothetical protein
MPVNSVFSHSFTAGKRPGAFLTGEVTATGLISLIDIGNTASYNGIGNTATDLTVNSIDLTMVGNPVYNTTTNYSVALDGVNNYLITENLRSNFDPGNGTVSVDIWLRPTDNGVVLNEQGSITSPRWYDSQLEIVNGVLKMGLWNGSRIVSTTVGDVTFGTWQNYVITYDGVTLRGYINGQLGGSINVVKANPWDSGYNYFYGIMGSTSLSTNLGDGTRLAGDFGILRIYNVALSADEVKGNCNGTRNRYNV